MTLAIVLGAILIVLIVILVLSAFKVIPEYERAVFFRIGHLKGAKGPGLLIVLPVIDKITRVSLRTVALAIPVQELVTKDNVTVKVTGVTYYAVRDPIKAVMDVQDYQSATAQVSQVTLLTVLRQFELDAIMVFDIRRQATGLARIGDAQRRLIDYFHLIPISRPGRKPGSSLENAPVSGRAHQAI